MQSPVSLFPHYFDRAHQPVGCVSPIRLNSALSRAGISGANSLDYGVVFGPGCCDCVEQKRDIHPDIPLRLRFHGVVQGPKPRAGAGFDIAAVKSLVELVQLARLSASGGCRPPEIGIEGREVFHQALPVGIRESRGAPSR